MFAGSLTPEQRMDDEHMAAAMYAERISWEFKHGRTDLDTRNPDARVLYFKGIYDTLTTLDTWADLGLPPETLAAWINKLREQTKKTSTN